MGVEVTQPVRNSAMGTYARGTSGWGLPVRNSTMETYVGGTLGVKVVRPGRHTTMETRLAEGKGVERKVEDE